MSPPCELPWVYAISRRSLTDSHEQSPNYSKTGLKPHKVKVIQSFLGFRETSTVTSSTNILGSQSRSRGSPGKVSFGISMNECRSAFETLKKRLSTSPPQSLTHWILDMPITVETDASDYGAFATVLSITNLLQRVAPSCLPFPHLFRSRETQLQCSR